MLTAESLAAFTGVSLLLCIAPGPDNLFVLLQSMLHGRTAGLRVTLGLCTGLVVHTCAVAVGVAALLQASPVAFNAIRVAGAALLLWLAWQAFTAASVTLNNRDIPPLTGWQYYRRGIIMNVTNPKVMLFFLALLPQFTDPLSGPIALQLVLLGAVFISCTLLVFGAIALLAGRIGESLQASPCMQRVLNAVAGLVFVGVAARLLLV